MHQHLDHSKFKFQSFANFGIDERLCYGCSSTEENGVYNCLIYDRISHLYKMSDLCKDLECRATITCHSKSVVSLSYSFDGTLLATACEVLVYFFTTLNYLLKLARYRRTIKTDYRVFPCAY